MLNLVGMSAQTGLSSFPDASISIGICFMQPGLRHSSMNTHGPIGIVGMISPSFAGPSHYVAEDAR